MKNYLSILSIKDSIFMIVGSFFASLGMILFLVPNQMVTGGTAGLSLLLHHVMTFFSIGVWMTVINLPLLLLGIKYFGKNYAVKSIITILLISAFVDILKEFLEIKSIVDDDILASVFGGIFIGIGIGLVLKVKSSAGGTTILAAIIASKTHYKAAEVLLFFDGIIILLSYLVFGDIEKVLFSVISIYATAKVIDVLISGRVTKKTVHLVTSKVEDISKEIIKEFGPHGTILKGKNLDTKSDKKMILVVVDAAKIQVLNDIARKYDDEAFLVISDASELHGRGY